MKYALMFPGQGSQSLGMLGDLDAPQIAATWQEAGEALGWDVGELVRGGPVEELNRTDRTQPALLAASIAVWRVWTTRGRPAPTVLAGHSLGEYSALVAAGSIDFGDALRLGEKRGQLMQAAVPPGTGGMAAVLGLDEPAMETLCAQCSAGVLEPVNYNAPGQIVAAGEVAALDWLEQEGPKAGAMKVVRLPVSVPSHCSLMREAAEQLGEALEQIEIRAPQLPVLHNLDAEARDNPADIRQALREQLFKPVRWTRTLAAMQSLEVQALLECGPGKVLCGLAKRGARGTTAIPLESTAGLEKADALMNEELA